MATIICGQCEDISGQPNFKISKYDYQANGNVLVTAQFSCGTCERVVSEGQFWIDCLQNEEIAIGVNAKKFPHHPNYRKAPKWA